MKTREEIEEKISLYRELIEGWEEYDRIRIENNDYCCYAGAIHNAKQCINDLLWVLKQ